MGNSGSYNRGDYLPEAPIAPLLPSAAEQRRQRLASGRIVLVCGPEGHVGQEDGARVWAALDTAHAREPITLLMHCCTLDLRAGQLLGVDRWAAEWARARGVPVEPHPLNPAMWGGRARQVRDRQVAERGAHGVIAFPGADQALLDQTDRWATPVWWPFGRGDPPTG